MGKKGSAAEKKGSVAEKKVPDLRKGTYGDGRPLDELHYLQCKIILKPEGFTSVDSFRDFGKIVRKTAEIHGVGFITDPGIGRRPHIREIVFGDTADFRLYNNAFILRKRVTYEDGFPVGDPEIVFKFRHPDLQKAAEVDVRAKISGAHVIKFKVEALPLRDQLGGYRVLYSHNCNFGLSQLHDADRTSMKTLVRVFPALSFVKKSDDERIELVNQAIVEEVLLDLGQLDFGKGTVGKCNVALWRSRGDHKPLVGEFAFQVKFEKKEDVREKAKERCEQFLVSLQHDAKAWVLLGATKTGIVYRMNGNAPQSHE